MLGQGQGQGQGQGRGPGRGRGPGQGPGPGQGQGPKKLSLNGTFFWPKRPDCESPGRFRPNPGTSGQNSGTHATFTGRK